jgi:ComF family protein
LAARAVALLADPADALVHALKYGGWPELGAELSSRMARVPLPDLPDLAGVPIVPVPTTRRRLRDRGYNQARVLAEGVARATGGILLEALWRREGGESQVALHPEERRANVKGAFLLHDSLVERIRGRNVVLVDDVLTTGATAAAAAEALGAGGARGVILLTFARALPG